MNARTTTSRFAAGLQAGMAGALLMLAWLALSTLWARHSVWWFPNLIATTFGGDEALQARFDKYTLSGLALHVLQYSAVGVLFAAVMPRNASRFRLTCAGVIVAVAYYYATFGFFWKHWNPLIPLYSPERSILIGHVLFGLMLGRLAHYMSDSVPAIE